MSSQPYVPIPNAENPFDFLLPEPEQPLSGYRWATVVSASPLRIVLDGDDSPLTVTPWDMSGPREPGERVYCLLYNRRVTVIGPRNFAQLNNIPKKMWFAKVSFGQQSLPYNGYVQFPPGLFQASPLVLLSRNNAAGGTPTISLLYNNISATQVQVYFYGISGTTSGWCLCDLFAGSNV